MNKELKIEVPEGYEIDRDKSTFEKIVFKKKKKITLNDVYKALGLHDDTEDSSSVTIKSNNDIIKKIVAENNLANVARYLNNGWIPIDGDTCYYFCVQDMQLYYESSVFLRSYRMNNILFKSKEFAEQAIEILGKEKIKLAIESIY